MPGPKEPKSTNTFLKPLVDELATLYNVGITFRNPTSLLSLTTVRTLLCCVSCDLPATRKVCGFQNFNGLYGCSKCLKQFPTETFGSKPNYGGFDMENWQHRDNAVQRRKGLAYKDADTLKKRHEVEQTYGAKYSELLNLPHFNIVKYHVVDPMHNLFLGLAKYTINTWKKLRIIKEHEFNLLQNKIDSVNPPTKLGRIPRKVSAGFQSFTADEWKYWILIYSVYVLHGVIPDSHYKCWCTFVECCQLFCLPVITTDHVEKAHSLLMKFCISFESLYGKEFCTPNMHMSCHLKDCILDFGPLSSFWCFAFERYNGTLESFHKSWCGPEKQMFHKLTNLQHLLSCDLTDLYKHDDLIRNLCSSIDLVQKHGTTGSYSSFDQAALQDIVTIKQLPNFTGAVSAITAYETPFQFLVPPFKEKWLDTTEMAYLKVVYNALYPQWSIMRLARCFQEYKQVIVNGEEFISTISRSQRSCTIAAHWLRRGLTIDLVGEEPLRIGIVTAFIRHKVDCAQSSQVTTTISHIFARVKWYMNHTHSNYLHPSVIVCANVFEPFSPASFIPLSRIAARCAVSTCDFTFDYGTDRVTFAIPMLKSL